MLFVIVMLCTRFPCCVVCFVICCVCVVFVVICSLLLYYLWLCFVFLDVGISVLDGHLVWVSVSI